MIQANVFYEKSLSNSIFLLVYENGELNYAHSIDNNLMLIKLVKSYGLSSITMKIVGESTSEFPDMEKFLGEMCEQNIEVTSIELIEVEKDHGKGAIGHSPFEELSDLTTIDQYRIVIAEANSQLLINSFLDNGYIVSKEKIGDKIQLRVHGCIFE